MNQLLILYHTQSGRNRQLAFAAQEGAQKEAVEVRCLKVQEAGVEALLSSQAVLFVTPENFGALAGATKDFFDRTFYAVEEKQLNLPYALIVGCGNDGTGAIRQLEKIAKAYPLKRVAEPLVVHGAPTGDDLQAAEELGQTLAAGLEMGIF